MTDPVERAEMIATVAELRELGVVSVEMERTRHGTWKIKAVWQDQAATRHVFQTGRKAG